MIEHNTPWEVDRYCFTCCGTCRKSGNIAPASEPKKRKHSSGNGQQVSNEPVSRLGHWRSDPCPVLHLTGGTHKPGYVDPSTCGYCGIGLVTA